MRFTLTIELGNDAMQTARDVTAALKIVGKRIQGVNMNEAGQYAPVMDDNGNKVGRWEVIDETACAVCGKPAAKHGHWSATDPSTHQWKARA